MFVHTDHSHDMKVSYIEASQSVSCNLFTHLAWLITEVGERGLVHVNPKQHEQVLNSPAAKGWICL